MSGTRWAEAFDWGAFAGGEPGSGDFTQGDLSTERAVQYLSFAVVSQYPALKDFLELNDMPIDTHPIRWPFEFKKLPRLQCYLGSLGGDLVATQISLDAVRVYWGLRLAQDQAFGLLDFGEPSFDSLLGLVRTALISNSQLAFSAMGESRCIARRSRQDGELNYLVDLDEVNNRRIITVELPWLYMVKTDVLTGSIAQLL